MKITNKLRTLRSYANDKVLLIYQMGKVGSSSIENSLLGNGEYKIFHLHSLSKHLTFCMYQKFNAVNYYFNFFPKINHYKKHFLMKYAFKKNKSIKIISLVREPISRNLSMYFQDIQIPIMEISKENSTRQGKKIFYEKLEEEFFKKFNHEYGVKWFDVELKRSFGVDVYNYPFDKKRGYTTINKGNIELMIIRMENLNSLETEISNFLKIDDFRLVNTNIGDKKWYAPIYKDFKNNIILDENYIYSLYDTKYMKHFYTDEEMEKFKNKWLGDER